MRSALKASVVHLREQLRIVREGIIDTARAIKWGSRVDSAFAPTDESSLECQLTKDYHRVEKGLALNSPKRPFGKEVHSRLTAGVGRLPRTHGLRPTVESAITALQDWNLNGNRSEEIAPRLIAPTASPKIGAEWFFTRHSVRSFDLGQKLDPSEVSSAIETASRATPSVCNRQAWHVYLTTDTKVVRDILQHQNGNAGFRDSVPCVAVVTVSRRLFTGAGERSQHLIDGGLFSMTLAWVLHGAGLASCMLNWSMSNAASARLRKRIGASRDQEVVMMIAIGHPSADARVARSPRRPVEEVSSIIHL